MTIISGKFPHDQAHWVTSLAEILHWFGCQPPYPGFEEAQWLAMYDGLIDAHVRIVETAVAGKNTTLAQITDISRQWEALYHWLDKLCPSDHWYGWSDRQQAYGFWPHTTGLEDESDDAPTD